MAPGGKAILFFAIYRLLLSSVPTLWLLTDRIVAALGSLVGLATGQGLWVGATFAGLDFLLLSGLLTFFVLRDRGIQDRGRIINMSAILLLMHAVYLGVVSFGSSLQDLLGAASPWNLPILARGLHITYLAFLFRRSQPTETSAPRAAPSSLIVLALLACALPIFATLPFGRSSLEGKKVVAHEKCFGNWDKPKHGDYGRLSIGMYGMLDPFVRSLGGEFLVSDELSAKDLRGADVLILLYPHEDWQEGQLERIEDFVRKGGSLLICGEHTTRDDNGKNRFNEVLEFTSMQVRYDSSLMTIGGWLQSYQALAHPSTAGIGDDRNEFGVVTGASMAISWPASPLLVGRWGWADPGDPKGEAQMGNGRYDSGEKLGDQILAAEQPIGSGTVIAFGDTSSMTNGITMGSHMFTARLLAYLGNRPGSPQAIWRQVLSLLCAGALLWMLIRASVSGLGMTAVIICGSLSLSTSLGHDLGLVLPDGRPEKINNLAYIDNSHMGRFDNESWRLDGDMGFKMTLVRSGYQALELQEFTRERVERAGLIASVAPSRAFTQDEIKIVHDFVTNGGIFILTTAYEDRLGSEALLRSFGFEIGRIAATPTREPQPMGHFKSPYLPGNGTYVYVRFHEGWPVSCVAPDAPPVGFDELVVFDEHLIRRVAGYFLGHAISSAVPMVERPQPARVIAYGNGNHPSILKRVVGKGSFVVVADSGFILNKNLEVESGEEFEGKRENAEFWHWFLTDLRGEEAWIPPEVRPRKGR